MGLMPKNGIRRWLRLIWAEPNSLLWAERASCIGAPAWCVSVLLHYHAFSMVRLWCVSSILMSGRQVPCPRVAKVAAAGASRAIGAATSCEVSWVFVLCAATGPAFRLQPTIIMLPLLQT